MTDFNYSKNPAPVGACPVCWHRYGKTISDLTCDLHTHDERLFLREKEKAGFSP
jgi:hypothetical protein